MTLVRPFRAEDAGPTRRVFARAVLEGTGDRYTDAERAAWLPDPAMPDGWGDWLARHICLVSEDRDGITGFMLLERDGYLNMAYVLPDRMGTGTADALHAAILAEARALHLPRLTTLASRYAQGFFRRHGWQLAPDLPPRDRQDPLQGPQDNPVHRPMALVL